MSWLHVNEISSLLLIDLYWRAIVLCIDVTLTVKNEISGYQSFIYQLMHKELL
jgi:hypothetical protein